VWPQDEAFWVFRMRTLLGAREMKAGAMALLQRLCVLEIKTVMHARTSCSLVWVLSARSSGMRHKQQDSSEGLSLSRTTIV
jgi:hypothetical protein